VDVVTRAVGATVRVGTGAGDRGATVDVRLAVLGAGDRGATVDVRLAVLGGAVRDVLGAFLVEGTSTLADFAAIWTPLAFLPASIAF
jgi:hypothetical protein